MAAEKTDKPARTLTDVNADAAKAALGAVRKSNGKERGKLADAK